MFTQELNDNMDATLKTSVNILEKRIKSLKKRNIPDRMRRLLCILDHCKIEMYNGHLTTAALVLSAFPREMDALRASLMVHNYSPRKNIEILKLACVTFRINRDVKK
jgi:hypothetical protein